MLKYPGLVFENEFITENDKYHVNSYLNNELNINNRYGILGYACKGVVLGAYEDKNVFTNMNKFLLLNLFQKGYKYCILEVAHEKVDHFIKNKAKNYTKIIHLKRIYDYIVNGKLFKAPVFQGYKNPTMPIVIHDLEKMINLDKIKPKF